MYRAAVKFADLQDNGRIYEAGEQFPRLGFAVSDERIKELAGSNNRMGYPLIKQIPDEKQPEKAPEEAPAKPARKPRQTKKG